MALKVEYMIGEMEHYPLTLSITMTVSTWRELQRALGECSRWPTTPVWFAINGALSNIDKLTNHRFEDDR